MPLLDSYELRLCVILEKMLQMRQYGLINRVIEALEVDNLASKVNWNTDDFKPIIKYEDGLQVSGQFSYSSIVVIVLYLAGHTCPEISYAVNCYARYMLRHSHSHKVTLKRVVN